MLWIRNVDKNPICSFRGGDHGPKGGGITDLFLEKIQIIQ